MDVKTCDVNMSVSYQHLCCDDRPVNADGPPLLHETDHNFQLTPRIINNIIAFLRLSARSYMHKTISILRSLRIWDRKCSICFVLPLIGAGAYQSQQVWLEPDRSWECFGPWCHGGWCSVNAEKWALPMWPVKLIENWQLLFVHQLFAPPNTAGRGPLKMETSSWKGLHKLTVFICIDMQRDIIRN